MAAFRRPGGAERKSDQRAFAHLPVLSAEVEFVLQTRGPEHVAEIVAALGRAGFGAEVIRD